MHGQERSVDRRAASAHACAAERRRGAGVGARLDISVVGIVGAADRTVVGEPAGAGRQCRQRQAAAVRRRRDDAGQHRGVRRRSRQRPGVQRAARQRHLRPWQRPAHPGTPEHRRRLEHVDHRRLAGDGGLDEQHVPHQRPALHQPHGGLRRRRAAGRDAGPVGRARRAARRPDRVRRRPRRLDRRAHARLPHVPVGSRCDDQLHRPDRRRGLHAFVRPAVRPSRRLRRPARLRRGRAGAGDGVGGRPEVLQPAAGDAHAASSTSARTSTASTRTSTTTATTAG